MFLFGWITEMLVALAGLWDRWRDPDSDEELISCTIIVTGATEWMTPYHDRMPVFLQQVEIDRWLAGDMSADELHPAAESALREWPIEMRRLRIFRLRIFRIRL